MTTTRRREFLGLAVGAIAASALPAAARGLAGDWVPRGLPVVPNGPVMAGKDRGVYVVYDARSLEPLHAETRGRPLPERTPAASVSKTFCAYAALRGGWLGENETLLCDGDEWKPDGHGPLTVVDALALSCNAFFEKLGARLTWTSYGDACERLGGISSRLGAKPPNLLDRLDAYAHGSLLATGCEELARIARAVALAGPADAALAAVRRGWREAVVRGTAVAANAPGLDVAGKTGTLKGPDGEKKFAAFAPLAAPRWVLAVRTAGAGGASAAEIAGRVFAKLGS
jgi:hypothetical protein